MKTTPAHLGVEDARVFCLMDVMRKRMTDGKVYSGFIHIFMNSWLVALGEKCANELCVALRLAVVGPIWIIA